MINPYLDSLIETLFKPALKTIKDVLGRKQKLTTIMVLCAIALLISFFTNLWCFFGSFRFLFHNNETMTIWGYFLFVLPFFLFVWHLFCFVLCLNDGNKVAKAMIFGTAIAFAVEFGLHFISTPFTAIIGDNVVPQGWRYLSTPYFWNVIVSVLFINAGLIKLFKERLNKSYMIFGITALIFFIPFDFIRFLGMLSQGAFDYGDDIILDCYGFINLFSSSFIIWHVVCYFLCLLLNSKTAKVLIWGSVLALIIEVLIVSFFYCLLYFRSGDLYELHHYVVYNSNREFLALFIPFDLVISLLFSAVGLLFLYDNQSKKVPVSFAAFFIVIFFADFLRFLSISFSAHGFHDLFSELEISWVIFDFCIYLLVWHVFCGILCFLKERKFFNVIFLGSFSALILELVFLAIFWGKWEAYVLLMLLYIPFDFIVIVLYSRVRSVFFGDDKE